MNHDDENVNTRERITLEIPASRKALSDWYNADRNKRMIYWMALALWVLIFLFMMTILPLTATSSYRVAFYLPLVVFMILLGLSTHWLIQASLNDYTLQCQVTLNSPSSTVFYSRDHTVI